MAMLCQLVERKQKILRSQKSLILLRSLIPARDARLRILILTSDALQKKEVNSLNCSLDAQNARNSVAEFLLSTGEVSSEEEADDYIEAFEKEIEGSIVALPTSDEEAEYGKGFWTENWTGGHRYWAFDENGDVQEIDLDSSNSSDSSIKSDLEAVLATGDRNAIHHVVDDSGYGEKMMDAVGKFLAFTYGYSWEEDADAETWTVREDEGAGDLVGIIIDEDIANVNAEALVRNNLDWDKSVQDVCAWVVDQLGLPAPPSRLNIELDEAQLKKLYDIAEIYNTSNPISGSWEHEVEHEQAAISRGLGVSLEEAKEIMKQYLGFDDSNFE